MQNVTARYEDLILSVKQFLQTLLSVTVKSDAIQDIMIKFDGLKINTNKVKQNKII